VSSGRGASLRSVEHVAVEVARKPEVHDAHTTVAIDHGVVALEVAVDQSRPVHRDEPATCGDMSVDDLSPRSWPLRDPTAQRHAIDELHREIDERVVVGSRPRFVDRDDIRVRDLGHRARLGDHPAAQHLRVVGVAGKRAHELDRHAAIELRVVGREHHPHATATDRRHQQVATDGVPHMRAPEHRLTCPLLGDLDLERTCARIELGGRDGRCRGFGHVFVRGGARLETSDGESDRRPWISIGLEGEFL
jgi:hypothetical protein